MGEINVGGQIQKESGSIRFIKRPLSSTTKNPLQTPDTNPNDYDLPISIHDKKTNAHENRFSEITKDYNEKISLKVTAENGKSLSTNDLTTELKTAYDDSVTKKHLHTNKQVLDLIINAGTGNKFLSDNAEYKEIDLSSRAKTDLSNISSDAKTNLNTAGIRTVVETYTNGVNWYRKYSDGWIEQGGIAGQSSATTSTVVTLLLNYKNTNYNMFAIDIGGACLPYGASATSTSSFTWYHASASNLGCRWFAYGY